MSSKTPKVTAKKTASGLKNLVRALIGLAGLAVIAFFVQSGSPPVPSALEPQLKIGARTFALEVPEGEAGKQKGLSGREQLPRDTAMLFVFDEPGEHCFWMKDMKFFIDIVWLDADRRVVYIKQNADPASYPQSFCPPSPAKYVLEFNAGTTASLDLMLGQQLSF